MSMGLSINNSAFAAPRGQDDWALSGAGPQKCTVTVKVSGDLREGEFQLTTKKSNNGQICRLTDLEVDSKPRSYYGVYCEDLNKEETLDCCFAAPEDHAYPVDLRENSQNHKNPAPRTASEYADEYFPDVHILGNIRSGACHDLDALPRDEQFKIAVMMQRGFSEARFSTSLPYLVEKTRSIIHTYLKPKALPGSQLFPSLVSGASYFLDPNPIIETANALSLTWFNTEG